MLKPIAFYKRITSPIGLAFCVLLLGSVMCFIASPDRQVGPKDWESLKKISWVHAILVEHYIQCRMAGNDIPACTRSMNMEAIQRKMDTKMVHEAMMDIQQLSIAISKQYHG